MSQPGGSASSNPGAPAGLKTGRSIVGAIVRARDVGWRAGRVPVVERVSFDVRPGEFVALMGRNGAGKSTIVDIVAGLRAPSEGAVTLAGRPLSDWTGVERARLVAHLPQSVRADLALTAEALVLTGRYPHATGWFESAEDRDDARIAMERCGCLEFRRRIVGTLSGGERQRVFLAACLAQRPRLLLLDEPATYLDVDQQLECFSILRAEVDRGAACLAVTHDINLALTFSTRLLVLAERTIAHDLAADTALDDPRWLQVFSRRLIVQGFEEFEGFEGFEGDKRAVAHPRPWVRFR
jgi:iron complex transport system ATP-binding protein